MNVLSLFDGMSCGQIALNKLGIKVDNYFASEIDKFAIKITQKNFPNTKQVGSVEFVTEGMFLNHKIDLLIGGSPCQGFSFAGKQLNFDDPQSKLFFEFLRILKETKPKFFLLENVKMKKEYQNIISDFLKVEPIEINSSLLSAQNRKRLYWTNIPNIEQPKDNNKTIKSELGYKSIIDAIYNKRPKRIYNEKAPTIRAGRQGQTNEKGDKLTPNDYEKLQTVSLNYTKGVSNSQRYKMLGNGWTVDVVCHIFKNMKNAN
tara:strand:+ start:40 stop:819 length:780 start_codon:yes stop_codon:yes gene_type:complete